MTIAIELPVASLLLRRRCSPARLAQAIILANAVSHPALWLAALSTPYYWPTIIIGEFVVVAIEWGILRSMVTTVDSRSLLAVSLLVNSLSVLIGTGLTWPSR